LRDCLSKADALNSCTSTMCSRSLLFDVLLENATVFPNLDETLFILCRPEWFDVLLGRLLGGIVPN